LFNAFRKLGCWHATHDSKFPQAKFLSETDLAGNEKKAQYGIFYDKPVSNSDMEITTVDVNKTAQLNSDSGHLVHVHMNARVV
jgi:hypothetical protein